MTSVVERIREALPCPVYANDTDVLGECAVYDFSTAAYDGAKRRTRLKVHLFAGSMERGIELETRLDEALVSLKEAPLTPTVTSCARNGGGWLKDGDRHVRIAYYDITLRA